MFYFSWISTLIGSIFCLEGYAVHLDYPHPKVVQRQLKISRFGVKAMKEPYLLAFSLNAFHRRNDFSGSINAAPFLNYHVIFAIIGFLYPAYPANRRGHPSIGLLGTDIVE
ncbi:hypothetical protein [Pedobacter miscanthi]|uniref:Uncharacterized protein n=1 Tax=Pedobacter miscanthi TaxID=2259170 RepID=A0A366LCZ0_9SPHI|nr:hypothetical protein [Pedobacter miscanthi]RBQ11755.1 hypothetical protein DRW42_00300 [Pedobacter miscanthi]